MMLLGAMAFSSCDMDLKPVDRLEEETAIQNSQDLRKFRNTLYTNLRSVTSGAYIYLTDIQLDGFNGLISNGNNLSDFSYGQIYPTNENVTGYWSSNYVMISNANALIGKAEGLRGIVCLHRRAEGGFRTLRGRGSVHTCLRLLQPR